MEYVVLLAVVAVMLAPLRSVAGSLWAAVAGHVTFLLLDRTLLGVGETGVDVVLPPGGELLVLGDLVVVAVLGGILVARRHRAPDRCRWGYRLACDACR